MVKEKGPSKGKVIDYGKEETETDITRRFPSPTYQLIKRLVHDRIPYIVDIRRMENDKRYSMRSVEDEEDIISINKAIDNAISEDRINESPPPVIGVTTRIHHPGFIQWVYIKNDLLESRKKKRSHTKIKRSMKHPVVHGNKRVVMKKKGGRK